MNSSSDDDDDPVKGFMSASQVKQTDINKLDRAVCLVSYFHFTSESSN